MNDSNLLKQNHKRCNYPNRNTNRRQTSTLPQKSAHNDTETYKDKRNIYHNGFKQKIY